MVGVALAGAGSFGKQEVKWGSRTQTEESLQTSGRLGSQLRCTHRGVIPALNLPPHRALNVMSLVGCVSSPLSNVQLAFFWGIHENPGWPFQLDSFE